MAEVIGYDDGRDARWSYVECTQYTFHGRPMNERNASAVSE